MKIIYEELEGKPRILQSLTGLNHREFEALLLSFEEAWNAFVEETFKSKQRQRAYGAGRRGHLKGLRDKFLFILVYFRLYPTQEVQGFLFGLSQAQANVWVYRLSPILNQALGYEQQ
jgi:Helix-turn-helix of DDE superfamily endonuclease